MVSIITTSDYKGKVSGSVVQNPNKAYRLGIGTTLYTPSQFTVELDTTGSTSYQRVDTLDGVLTTQTNLTNGAMAQQLFSFDIIQILERQLGVNIWQGKTLLSDKRIIASQIIQSMSVDWYGYGSSVGGNKATIRDWANGATAWANPITHSNGVVQKLTTSLRLQPSANILWFLDNNGFYHVLANAEASDGVTQTVINTDYIVLNLTVELQNTNSATRSVTQRTKHKPTDKSQIFNDTISPSVSKYSPYINVDGYDEIVCFVEMLQNTSNYQYWTYWSFDGVNLAYGSPTTTATATDKSMTSYKVVAPYFQLGIKNNDASVSKNTSATVTLKG